MRVPGFEFMPVPPAVFPEDFANAPTLGQDYFSLVVHVFHSMEVGNQQTPYIYQLGYAAGLTLSFTLIRFSRDFGETWSPWSATVPTNHAVDNTTFGAATATNWGHVRVINNLSNTGATDALSANQGRLLRETDRTGSWTPTWPNGAFSVANHGAVWSKAGGLCFVTCDITVTRTATTNVNIDIGGLPFSEHLINGVPVGFVTISTLPAAQPALVMISGTVLQLINQAQGRLNTNAAGIATAVNSAARIRLGATYRVAW